MKTIHYILFVTLFLAGGFDIVFAHTSHSPYNTTYQNNYVSLFYVYTEGCYTYQYNRHTGITTLIDSNCPAGYSYYNQYTQTVPSTYTVSPYQNYYTQPTTYYTQPTTYYTQPSYYTSPSTTNYTYEYINSAWDSSSSYNNSYYYQSPSTYYGSQANCYYQNGYQMCY